MNLPPEALAILDRIPPDVIPTLFRIVTEVVESKDPLATAEKALEIVARTKALQAAATALFPSK